MKKFLIPGLLLLLIMSSCQREFEKIRNVVVILSDDHALNVTGCYGNQIIRTPNIDRLAREGITFHRAYCNAPICSASRQSLLTGKYPHATGVNLLFTPFPDEGNVTIAEHLREKGYETAIIGKTHWNNWVWYPIYEKNPPDHGFNTIIENAEYRSFLEKNPPPPIPGEIEYYSRKDINVRENTAEWMNCNVLPQPIDDHHSQGTYFARQAIRFMKENRDHPFFLWLAFKEPHQPYYFPYEFAGKYNPEDMPLPEGSPEDDRWIPEIHKKLTDREKRGIIASYYTSTEYLDKNIGLVLDALESMDLSHNTLVIYISDNGYLLNEHRRFEKHTMWEEANRQPLIMRVGNDYRPGEQEGALVEYIDIVPTVLDIIGSELLRTTQGKSFTDVITNRSEDHNSYVFSEYLTDNMAMIANKKWKYIFTTGSRDLGIGYKTGYGPSGIVHRLYNLEEDPLEHHDVSHLEENKETLKMLQQEMIGKFMETHPDASNCPEKLTPEGKLVWFCEPRDIGDDQTLDEVPKRIFKN
ncbi:MAG: sulfatase-like hydrolase/transferase [Bacteroidales bacterium]|nr:sulfatase-like hydrolase/transferase [Bacteroidales bacterium]